MKALRWLVLPVPLWLVAVACGGSNDSEIAAGPQYDARADAEDLVPPVPANDAGSEDAARDDASSDAEAPGFDPTVAFATVTATALTEVSAFSLRDDQLELFFVRSTDTILRRVERASTDDDFGAEEELTSSIGFGAVALSRDGLSLFTLYGPPQTEPGVPPPRKFYRLDRATTADDFGEPVELTELGEIGNGINVVDLQLSADELALYSRRGAGNLEPAVNALDGAERDNELRNLPNGSLGLAPSADGLHLYFGYIPGYTVGGDHPAPRLAVMSRTSSTGAFSFAREIPVEGQDDSVIDRPGWISADQTRVYFLRGGTVHIGARELP